MRRLLVLFIAVVLVAPSAAVAGESDAPEEPPLVPLHELTKRVEDYIQALTRIPTFGVYDRVARRRQLIVGVDLFIGSIRAEAIRYVDSEVPEPVRTVINDLPGGSTIDEVLGAVNEAAADPVTTWVGQDAGLELVELRAAIDRLRALVESTAPVRVCPVELPVLFTNDWGDDRPGDRSHKGTDVYAPIRTPVIAIESGVVIQANYHYSGGRQIYFRADATGDVYYYAHLDSWAKWIWTGTRIEAGDVIGYLGQSGNAHSPHVHFGWMPGSKRVDLDNLQNPYPLLLEICR